MDLLSDILDELRLKGTLYFTTEFSRPWGLRVPRFHNVARFHLVVRGSTWVRVFPGDEAFHLEAGDLVLIPHGAEHVLADTEDTPCRMVDDVIEEAGFTGEDALIHGGPDDGAPTRLVCGHLAFDEGVDHLLLTQLPPALVVRWADAVAGSPLEDVVRFIGREAEEARAGHRAVTRRLSEVLFVQAVRFWADSLDEPTGVIAALRDPRLGSALAAIHAEPAQKWTVGSLARKAAMSRTLFAECFRDVVGATPHEYLTAWRIQIARRLLTESGLTLERIGRRVGYDSGASFSRAFRKIMGKPPGAYRRARRGELVEGDPQAPRRS